MRDLTLVVLLLAGTLAQAQPEIFIVSSPHSSGRAESPMSTTPVQSRPNEGNDAFTERANIGAPHNWSQKGSEKLVAGAEAAVKLTPCPVGVDTSSGAGYKVYISGEGHSEAVSVLNRRGGCKSGAPSGTITIIPYYDYAAGYTIGSASSGLQEMINEACGIDPTSWKNAQCNVTIPANGPGQPHSLNIYNVYGTIYLHANQSTLSGYGTSLNCMERGPCLQVGDLVTSNDFGNNTISGLSFRSPTNLASNPSFAGVAITQTQKASQVVTITTATAHGFRVGDMVTILFTDNNAFWGDAIVTAVPSATTFQYAHTGTDITAQSTPGVVALAYEAALDNGENTHWQDISYDRAGENGNFNNFFDFWDDENALVEHFNNNAIGLNGNVNWTGSFVFSAGNQGSGNQIAPVITVRDSNITANWSNCATDYNSNGLYLENTVCQASGPWEVYAANYTGNYQGAYIKNIYSESSICGNPAPGMSCSVTTPKSPFPGLGIAGLIAGATGLFGNFMIAGSGGMAGGFATGGSGTVAYSYFIVAKDTTSGLQTSPMQVLNYMSTGSDSITVQWPRVANGVDSISYDVIRIATPSGLGAVYPSRGNCNGGSASACGSVALNLSQSAACGNSLVCSYTDSGATTPAAYTVGAGNYQGQIVFWPGSIVTVNKTVNVGNENQNVVGVGLNGNAIQSAALCNANGIASGGGYTACTFSNDNLANQVATLMTDGASAGGGALLSKGRLNFVTTPLVSLQPHHIITLIDSNPGLTEGTLGYRPVASRSDTWIGTDVPSAGVGLNQGQLAMGAPKYIDFYINNTGDNASFLERLGTNQKVFNVPVKIEQGNSFTLGNGSALSRMKVYNVQGVTVRLVPAQSCYDIVVKVDGLTKSDQIAGITPPVGLGNLSLNAYPSETDALILHFCNASTLEALTPAGTYSFLAVH